MKHYCIVLPGSEIEDLTVSSPQGFKFLINLSDPCHVMSSPLQPLLVD